jgi:hypothetical protein
VWHITKSPRDGRAAGKKDTIAVSPEKGSKTRVGKIGGEMPFLVTYKCKFPMLF